MSFPSKTGIFSLILVLNLAGCIQRGEENSAVESAAPLEEMPSQANEVAGQSPVGGHENTVKSSAKSSELLFEEIAEKSGLKLRHESGSRGEFGYPEIVSAGICIADLNGDHHLDVYVPQGGPVPGDDGQRPPNRLFLNDGNAGFRDATAASGAANTEYGMGAYAADIDADGDLDLLLTNVGSLCLLRNNGDATFEDVTEQAGLAAKSGFWLNAVFADFNSDTILDLYVANYAKWDPAEKLDCRSPGGGADYCNPSRYEGLPDLLMFGRGDGTFEDHSEQSGVSAQVTRSMGVVAFDADQDGDQDIYVANDGQSNLLWINNGMGVFSEEALVRGAALNGAGAAEASMGVCCKDIDFDGDEDLIMSHLERETHTLYRNDKGFFTDVTAQAGLAGWSRPDTGFGIGFADFNLDGHWDLFAANGGVIHPTSPRNPTRPYAQADRVVMGQPGGKFPEAIELDRDREGQGATASSSTRESLVSRGSAFGDLDSDGRLDIVVAAKDGPLRLWRNTTEIVDDWVGVRPVAAPNSSSSQIGAVAYLVGTAAWSVVRPQGSYLGNHESIVRFGGVAKGQASTVEVVWRDKSRERFTSLVPGVIHDLVKGSGLPVESSVRLAEISTTEPDTGAFQSSTNESAGEERPAFRLPLAPIAGLPPFGSRTLDDGTIKTFFDSEELARWCRKAHLPPPPEVGGLDGPTWMLVHAAMKTYGENPSAQTLGSLAMIYDGNRAIETAAKIYSCLVQLEPENPKWWRLLGRVQFDSGRSQEAVRTFEHVATLTPDSAAVTGRLAEALLGEGNSAKSLKMWQKYVELKPNDPVGHIGLGRAAEVEGRLELALNSAERAIQLDPHARSALVLAARIAGKQLDKNRSQAYGTRASKLSKGDDPVLLDDVDLAMRKHSRSVSYLRQAVTFHKSKGNLKEAYEAAKLLAERRPTNVQNWQMLTWLALSQRNLTDAGKYAERALELDDEFAPAWETLARSRMAKQELSGALKAINQCLDVNPGFHHGYVTKGVILGVMKRWPESLQSLERGIKHFPDDVEGLISLAAAYANLQQIKDARVAIKRAIRLAPKNPLAQRIYLQLHQRK